MSGVHRPLDYVPVGELEGRPHVVVDGAPQPGTVLTLSHWPASPTPRPLWRDLSAEIAFAYLETREPEPGAVAVTNDHLDLDGLVALFALVEPQAAFERRDLLVEVARIGDFGVVTEDRAASVAFALATLVDPIRSPWALPSGASPDWTAACYTELLALLPECCDHPERFAPFAEAETAWLAAGRDLERRGLVTVDEHREAGLAVVELGDCAAGVPVAGNVGHLELPGVHPAVVHARTSAARVLVTGAAGFCYYDRYETWVRVVSRALPLRRDLAPLASALTQIEGGADAWHATTPGTLVPMLRPGDRSRLGTGEVLAALLDHLAAAPVAWDPFRAAGASLAGAQGVFSAAAASRSETSGRGPARWRGRFRARPST